MDDGLPTRGQPSALGEAAHFLGFCLLPFGGFVVRPLHVGMLCPSKMNRIGRKNGRTKNPLASPPPPSPVLAREAIEPPIHSLNLSDTDNGGDG